MHKAVFRAPEEDTFAVGSEKHEDNFSKQLSLERCATLNVPIGL